MLPQLAAPGVAAHEVKEACGFRVIFGPVRAADLPAFLAAGMKADAKMRRVTFDVRERATVVPEVLSVAWNRRMLLAYAGIIGASSLGRDGVSLHRGLRDGGSVIGAAWLALLAGGAVTPLALPYLPGRAFSGKGALAGGVLGAAATATLGRRLSPAAKLALLAGVTAASSYTAMDFTGSSTDHLALRCGGRDAQGAAPAGRSGCRRSRRLAGQQIGKVRAMPTLRYIEEAVTLQLDAERCNGCGMCVAVCPHAVFAIIDGALSSPTGAPAWSAAPAPSTACPGPST